MGRRRSVWRDLGLLTLVLAACGSPNAYIPSAAPSTSAVASVATQTFAVQSWPPGGPLPAELVGTWRPVDPALVGDLTFTPPNQYVFATPAESSGGNVVVSGTEIAFFNGALCGLRLPEGVGRYRWTISGGELRFEPLNSDPCGRGSDLQTRKYVKLG